MPKLNKKLAQQVDETEVQDFSVLPEGTYEAKLLEVEVKEGRTSGNPYWNWTFELETEDEASPNYEHNGRRIWVTTSLSEKALFKMKEVFLAFGYTTDSDTDELIGEKVKLVVTQEVATQGKKAGKVVNSCDQVLPLVDTGGDAGAAADDDDLFDATA